jgi:pimeloyl-ACP methyl ester carboxylesterase
LHAINSFSTCYVDELWTKVGECPVRYLKCGSGPPLVLVHGLLGSSFCWRFNLEALGAVRTVFAPDMPGLGHSGRIAEHECSLRTNAERLLNFMRACGLERADLLGNSHGGAIVMMMAALAPAAVERMILVAPVHPWMRERRFLLATLASAPGRLLMRAIAPQLGTLHSYFLRRMYGDPSRITPGTLEGYSAPIRIPGTIEHLLAEVRCWTKDLEQLQLLLPRLHFVPTLLVWGSMDGAIKSQTAGKLAELFESCRLEIIPTAGHLPFEELPDEFNRRVLSFLTSKPGNV